MATQTRAMTTAGSQAVLPRQATPRGQAPAELAEEAGLETAFGRGGRRKRFTRQSTAGEVVLAYLGAQAARLSALDLAVRRDKIDAVHQMRVTTRRLRSTLQAFPAVLSAPDTSTLRNELKWLGGVLGEARDAEVLAGYLHASLAALPGELVIGPAQARVTLHFAPVEASSRAALLEALDSGRYRTLVIELTRLLERPPLTPAAAEPAGKVLPRAVAKASHRVDRRMRQAGQAPAGQPREVALHETRKAAKRARYAAEAAAPGLGKQAGHKARRLAKRMKQLQSVLGDHQDAVIARTTAREIGIQAHLAGENAFSFGLLHERAYHQARGCQDEARGVYQRARRAARGNWLSAR
jgi:CHAD domain-containing protein